MGTGQHFGAGPRPLLGAHQAAFDDHLGDTASAAEGLRGDFGRIGVADIGLSAVTMPIERSTDSRSRSRLAVMPRTQWSARTSAGGGQVQHALEQAVGDDRLEGVQLQLARFGCEGDVASLPITSKAIWFTTSGITGLTLPGMIEEPAWRGAG